MQGPVAAGIGAMALGGVLLFVNIGGLLKLLRDSEIAQLPAAAEQGVAFAQAGTVVLHVDQPRLNTALRSATFALRDAAGAEVPSSPVTFHTTSSGFSTARISLRTFEVPRAGNYRLSVSGIAPGADLSGVTLVLARPTGSWLVLRILGIVAGGILLVGGLVLAALKHAGKI